MKQQQSNREREQMAPERENILREQEKLNQLNQLQTQVAALQNNSTRGEDDPENRGSPSLHALDELIQKRIMEANLPQHLISSTSLHDSPHSKDIQE